MRISEGHFESLPVITPGVSVDRHSRLVDRVPCVRVRLVDPVRGLMRSTLTGLVGIYLLLVSGSVLALLPAADTGNLYVSMWSSDEIAVFSPDGLALQRFTTEGLDGPRGIAFHPESGEIWVAGELSDSVYIFDHEHRFLRALTHPEFDEPVGITFIPSATAGSTDLAAVISNSNGNELMVFNLDGQLLRRIADDTLNDPNCSAVMSDGSLFVANRLGGSTGSIGSISRFSADEQFQFDFTTEGITSLMAVARNPNTAGDDDGDTVWASSGGGALGIHEFDQSGNLLQSLLPADIDGGSSIVPQGLSVDDEGDLHVVSSTGEVFRFNATGQFLQRFDTGPGTPRSSAFAICPLNCSTEERGSAAEADGQDVGMSSSESSTTPSSASSGGLVDLLFITLLACFGLSRRSLVLSSPLYRLRDS